MLIVLSIANQRETKLGDLSEKASAILVAV
jgi:hypothetical protein